MTPRARPVGRVVGRQPTVIIVAPSKGRFAWYGEIVGGELTGFDGHSITGGQRFTVEQVAQLIKRGIDVLTGDAITVRRNAHELWSGLHQAPPVYEFECPVIHRRADGRIRVIAPSGDEKLVEGDGWTTPYRKHGLNGKMAA